MKRIALLASVTVVVAGIASCGSDVDNLFDETPGAGGSGGRGGSGAMGPGPGPGPGPSPGPGGSTGETAGPTVTSSGEGGGPCAGDPNGDGDGDGFTANTGDCDDCDPFVGPNAFDFPANNLDEDCSGVLDDPPVTCDQGLDIADDDAVAGAQAIEICKKAAGPDDWGLLNATWTLADGSGLTNGDAALFHLGHGILSAFGPVPPRAGERLLGLSNGTARDANDPGYQEPAGPSKGFSSPMPPGHPKQAIECNGGGAQPPAQDPIAFEVHVRVPANAFGLAFDSSFYAYDWPNYVCSNFDDAFFATLVPAPPSAPDGNVAFYANGNLVSLNGAPFDVCDCGMPQCMANMKTYACSQGGMALVGTGYETHAATGWQVTTAPIEPGSQIILRLGVYDAGDSAFSALALLDRFRWLPGPAVAVSTTADP